jgi:hypothetical protein
MDAMRDMHFTLRAGVATLGRNHWLIFKELERRTLLRHRPLPRAAALFAGPMLAVFIQSAGISHAGVLAVRTIGLTVSDLDRTERASTGTCSTSALPGGDALKTRR